MSSLVNTKKIFFLFFFTNLLGCKQCFYTIRRKKTKDYHLCDSNKKTNDSSRRLTYSRMYLCYFNVLLETICEKIYSGYLLCPWWDAFPISWSPSISISILKSIGTSPPQGLTLWTDKLIQLNSKSRKTCLVGSLYIIHDDLFAECM